MKDSKNLVIGMLCAVICIMAVAYAAFSTTLTVNGTATIASNWKVEILKDNITCTTTPVAGGVTTGLTASGVANGGTTATFTMGLVQPGDTAECTVTITNSGTLDAEVETVTPTDADTTGPILFTVVGPKTGDVLAAGDTTTLKITATYDSTVTSQPGNVTEDLTVTIGYKQAGL